MTAAPALPREVDVVVVGAGLAGAVVTERLAREGIAVLCLERGRQHDPSEFPGDKIDFEVQALGPWNPSPAERRGAADYPVDAAASEMTPLFFNGVGGSTVLYGGHWMRFVPSDFRTRTLDGYGDDWPITYRDLAPWYDAADAAFGASGVAGDPAYPARPDYPLPPLPVGAIGQRVAAGHTRLGWHWWPGSNTIASRPYRGRRPCVQRSTCGHGCNEGAKGSADVTHWPLAVAAGAQLVTDARVLRVEVADGRATGVVVRRGDGLAERVSASLVVLAAGAIGTPRLLLASGDIANRSGLVGRRLMMHPFGRVVGYFDEDLGSQQGHWGQSLYSMEFAETNPSRPFVRGAKWNLTPTGGPLTAALFPREGRRFGAALGRNMREWLGRTAMWGFSCEDAPDPENRVTLSDGGEDPGVRVRYRSDDNARMILAFNAERARESLESAGAWKTVSLAPANDFGWHPLGTCRMGADPETSVAGPDGRAHDVAGLLIADGSLFVTGSCVNPAATVAALAARIADGIVSRRAA